MVAGVVVIGGGIIGASIAWRLAQRGARVTLLEARQFGAEASSAGAGMLAPGAEVTAPSPWSELALASWRAYSDFVEELESETRHPIDYRVCGALEPAYHEPEWAALAARAARQQPMGIPSLPLSPEEALRRAPALNPEHLVGALWYPADAIVNPRDVMSALRLALAARGVSVLEGVSVDSVEASPSHVTVRAAHQRWHAPAAVLAAGAWSSAISVSTPNGACPLPRAFPVRGHLTGYSLPPGALSPLLRRGHTYLLQRASGFLIAGASAEHAGFDRSINPHIQQHLRSQAAALLPGLLRDIPSVTWIGFRPGIDAPQPALGALPETRLWLAYGHYRNGILMAPATAQRIASEILALTDATAETD